MKEKQQNHSKTGILLVGGVVFCMFVLGIFFPQALWATHNPGLFPAPAMILVFLVAGVLFSLPLWWKKEVSFPSLSKGPRNLLFAGVALLAMILFATFPLVADYYGDAVFIKQSVNVVIKRWDSRLITEFFKPDFLNTKVGLQTYYQLTNYFTFLTGSKGMEVARVLGFLTGGLFVFLWLKLCDLNFKTAGWKILFMALGLSTPLLLVFMGHYETYFLSYAAILGWMGALGIAWKKKTLFWIIFLPFLYPIVLQTHITNWLLLPGLVLVELFIIREKYNLGVFDRLDSLGQKVFAKFKGVLSWQGLLLFYFLPALVVLLVSYFFIFANHDGPRQFSKDGFEDTLFLPLYTPEPAPFDRYNLFSGAHLLDYVNLMFMWSGAAVFLLALALTVFRKKVPWNDPLILISGSSALLFFAVFFMLNPLLSPMVDWDLFATPGLVVLPFLVFLFGKLEGRIKLRELAGPILALCLLSSTFLLVNTSESLLSRHLLNTGRWNFKTYWIGCSTSLLGGVKLAGNEQEQEAKLEEVIAELEPFSTPGNDKEFANLLLEKAIFQRNLHQNNQEALILLERAHTFAPRLGRNIYFLTVTHFEEGHFGEAYFYGDLLAKIRYQPYKKTLRMAIHVSLAAKEYQSAANYAVTYLNRWHDDPVIAEVEYRLRTGDRIDTIVELFSPG